MPAELHSQKAQRKISKVVGLLRSLVPRGEMFCLYNMERKCVWSSESADDFEIDNFMAMLPEEIVNGLSGASDVFRRTLPSARTVVLFPVCGDGGALLGILVSMFSKNAAKSASFNPNTMKIVLDPALDIIAENVLSEKMLTETQIISEEIEKELKLVYEVDEKIHGVSRRHSSLAQLVGQSGRYLGINYSVLLIPSKRIRISATHSSWKNVNRKVLDRYLVDQLLPKLEGQRQPLIFDIPAVEGSTREAEQGYQTLLSPLLDKHGNVEGVFAQLGRVDKSQFTNSDRRFMAHIVRKVEYVIEQSFDSMTGLMNRAGFEAQLIESSNTLTSQADTHQLIYLDLDNLQLVNDTFGRKAGDDVVMKFARLLEEDLPNTAVLSRLTGDEFCILLTHADSEAAVKYANEIREKRTELRYLEGDKSLQVTMSIGIAALSKANGDEGSALTTARMACESAKDHGRDRVEVFDDSNQSIIRRYDDMQLVAEIQQALDGHGFELRAQAITSLTGVSSSPRFEILLRMSDADGNRVPTDALFSAAERYHMMPQIDRWVVSKTIAALSEIRESVESQKVIFSINLSGQTLGDDDIFDFVEEEIRQSGLSPTMLCFEITESAAVSNLDRAQLFIGRLRKYGCTISLDDFGAGLSSFAYLKNFNVDTLKIDGSFIRDITENRISESMVAAITQVAQVMQLQTVAEYVESELTSKLLAKMGVDFAQGHLYGKPMPLETVLAGISDATQSSVV